MSVSGMKYRNCKIPYLWFRWTEFKASQCEVAVRLPAYPAREERFNTRCVYRWTIISTPIVIIKQLNDDIITLLTIWIIRLSFIVLRNGRFNFKQIKTCAKSFALHVLLFNSSSRNVLVSSSIVRSRLTVYFGFFKSYAI